MITSVYNLILILTFLMIIIYVIINSLRIVTVHMLPVEIVTLPHYINILRSAHFFIFAISSKL